TITRWVDAGAPEGNPADMPRSLNFSADAEWFIGEPDLLVTTNQDFVMYPNGPDWWIDQFGEVKLDEDRWIKAMEIKPSNPKGVVPKYQVRSVPIRNIPNDELEIPPNSVVRTDGYYRLTRNARIDAFQPHMHMRGRAMTLEAINLDNTTTVLSSVDRFNFNW